MVRPLHVHTKFLDTAVVFAEEPYTGTGVRESSIVSGLRQSPTGEVCISSISEKYACYEKSQSVAALTTLEANNTLE